MQLSTGMSQERYGQNPIRGCARGRAATQDAPLPYALKPCGASAAVARLSYGAYSAIARPVVQGGSDFSISGRTATCTSGVRVFTQLGGCDPNIYPARRAAQACAAAPPSLDALRCREWEVCIRESRKK